MAKRIENSDQTKFAIPKKNLWGILAGFLIMVLGYALLSGGASGNSAEFSPQIFSFRRLVIAPIVIILGTVVVTVFIMYRGRIESKQKQDNK